MGRLMYSAQILISRCASPLPCQISYTLHQPYSCSYYPPCHICGTPTYSQNYLRERKYTCDNCKTHAALSKLLKQDQMKIEKMRL